MVTQWKVSRFSQIELATEIDIYSVLGTQHLVGSSCWKKNIVQICFNILLILWVTGYKHWGIEWCPCAMHTLIWFLFFFPKKKKLFHFVSAFVVSFWLIVFRVLNRCRSIDVIFAVFCMCAWLHCIVQRHTNVKFFFILFASVP